MKIITRIIACIFFTSLAFAQTGDAPPFALSSSEVNLCIFFVFKQADKKGGNFLKINYTKENSPESPEITIDHPRQKVSLIVNGKPVSEVSVLKQNKGHSVELQITSPDEAFEITNALLNSPKKEAFVFVEDGSIPVFNLNSEDILKLVIMVYRDHTDLEVSFNSEKQAEFTKLVADNLQKKIRVSLNGKIAKELKLIKLVSGNSIKIEMPSQEEAFEMAMKLSSSTSTPVPKSGNKML